MTMYFILFVKALPPRLDALNNNIRYITKRSVILLVFSHAQSTKVYADVRAVLMVVVNKG